MAKYDHCAGMCNGLHSKMEDTPDTPPVVMLLGKRNTDQPIQYDNIEIVMMA